MSGKIYLGTYTETGTAVRYRADMPDEDRLRHTYIVGSAGSGKTELLKILMHHHATHDRASIVVVDAHTDVCEQVAWWPDEEMRGRVIYLAPELSPGMLPALNPLQLPKGATERAKEKIANRLAELIGDICRGTGGEDMSVRMVSVSKALMRVLLDKSNATLRDFYEMLGDKPPESIWNRGRNHPDQMIRFFFNEEWDKSDYKAAKSAMRARLFNLLLHKDFLHMTCSNTTLPFYDLIEEGKIILFSLGGAGEETAQIVGKMVMSMLAIVGDLRKDVERQQRWPVHVFVDECQNFMGPSVTTILKEMRKYGIHLTLANQYITDFNKDQQDAVLSNSFVKLMGPTAAPGPMLAAMGLRTGELQGIRNRQFMVKWGQNAPFTLDVRSDLADDKRRMKESQWIAFRMKQKPYYVAMDDPAVDQKSPAVPYVEDLKGFSRELD